VFNEWKCFHNLDTIRSIVDILKVESFIKNLEDILSFFVKDSSLCLPTMYDAPPSSLCDPKRVQRVGFAELVRNLVPLLASNTKRGRGVVLEAPGLD
jgi:hypothetical protein